jgi:heme A synthase
MSDSDHIENGRLRGLVALLSGAVALVTVGALAVLYTVDLGADVMLAVLAAVTLAAAP